MCVFFIIRALKNMFCFYFIFKTRKLTVIIFLRVYFDKKGILITKNQKHQQESSVRSKLMLILK